MADPRLTVVKMLMKMDSSEAYSNLLLDHVFSETDLSERDKAFAAALFYGVLERRLTLDYIIEKNSKIPFAKLDPAAVEILRTGLYSFPLLPISSARVKLFPPGAAQTSSTVSLTTGRRVRQQSCDEIS